MQDYIVLSDSNCELSEALRKRFGMTDYLPAHFVTPDHVDHLADMDWKLYPDHKEFYRQLTNKKLEFSTAPASPEECKAKFRPYLEKGIDIIFISLSSALSGTYSFLMAAKKDLDIEFPDRKIAIIDSMRYSVAVGMLVAKSCEMHQAGVSFDDNVAWIEENKRKIHEMGPMDDLFFLSRKGRVAKSAAFMGTLVGVKPLGDFDAFGMTAVLAKVMGINKAIDVTVEYVKRTIVHPEEQIIWLAHTDREKNALTLQKRLIEAVHPKETILITCNLSTAINVGPGLAACYYYGNEILEGNEAEKAVFASILGTK